MSAPKITYCAWCKRIIVDLPVPDSVVTLFPEFHRAYVNGLPVTIQDGICTPCRDTRFAEFPKKVTHDLAQK
jgi:hypothetical protein